MPTKGFHAPHWTGRVVVTSAAKAPVGGFTPVTVMPTGVHEPSTLPGPP